MLLGKLDQNTSTRMCPSPATDSHQPSHRWNMGAGGCAALKVLCVAFASLFRADELIFIKRHKYVRKAARGTVRHPRRFGGTEMGHRRPRQEQPLLRRVKGCLRGCCYQQEKLLSGKLVLMSQDINTKFSESWDSNYV